MIHARRVNLSVIALLALSGGIPQQGAAAGLVPFHARTREMAVLAPCDPSHVCVSITGTGEATQLGKISEAALFIIDPASAPAPGCTTNTGTMTFTGANGDAITLALEGINCQVTPTTGRGTESYVVIGGTGRFSGATGSGTEIVHIDTSNPAFSTGITDFSGTLSTPARSNRRRSATARRPSPIP
jgi:hypothetical protein